MLEQGVDMDMPQQFLEPSKCMSEQMAGIGEHAHELSYLLCRSQDL